MRIFVKKSYKLSSVSGDCMVALPRVPAVIGFTMFGISNYETTKDTL